MRTALAAVAVAALTVVTAIATRTTGFSPDHRDALAVVLLAGWVVFGLALLALRGVPERRVVPLVVVGSLAIGLAALIGPPNQSTDSARYAWDGIVQDAGTSPYAYVPVDDHLADLRTDWLFPAPDVASDGTVTCSQVRVQPTTTVPSGVPLCTALNRPQVPTIYPPVAEAYFASVRAVVPVDAEYWPLQVSGLLVSLALTGSLLFGMRRRGMPARWAALWGWCPFVAGQAVTDSHVDGLATLLLVLATLAATSSMTWLRAGRTDGWLSRLPGGSRLGGDRRAVVAGVLLGLATATKVLPALAAPPLLRRHGWRTITAAAVTIVLVYVPYVMLTGTKVIGYLPGYLNEEGYDSGGRFSLVTLLIPGTAATVVALLLVAGLAAWSWWRADPDRPWMTQVVLLGGALLIVRPATAWYALILLPFIALSRRWEWLVLPIGLEVSQMFGTGHVDRWSMGTCLVVVLGAAAWRRWGRRASVEPEPVDAFASTASRAHRPRQPEEPSVTAALPSDHTSDHPSDLPEGLTRGLPDDAPRVAVVGGSGLYSLFALGGAGDVVGAGSVRTIDVPTPFGPTSAPVTVGSFGGKTVAFLPRHGAGHTLPPHAINARANLWALARLGVRAVVSSTAVGGLAPELPPGRFVLPDQIFDRTTDRADTYFTGGAAGVEHLGAADPFCPTLRSAALDAARSLGEDVAPTATTVVIQGPRFSTRAESQWFRAAGGDIVNMTQYPETMLAAELGMGVVNLSFVTDTDAGVSAGDADAADASLVLDRMAAAQPRLLELLAAIVAAVPDDYEPRELVPREASARIVAMTVGGAA